MFTFPTTLGDLSTGLYAVLENCVDHRACFHFQPHLGTGWPVPTPCTGTVSTTEYVYVPNHARGLVNHSLHCARGLFWSPSDPSLGTTLVSYIWTRLIYNRVAIWIFDTLLQGSYFVLQQARGLYRYDAPGNASQYQNFNVDFSF